MNPISTILESVKAKLGTPKTYSPTLVKRIVAAGRIAELKRARKIHNCRECGDTILQSDLYYSVTIAGGGLGSIKFPDRVCVDCIDDYLEKRKKWEVRNYGQR